jgi:hypothetical protein
LEFLSLKTVPVTVPVAAAAPLIATCRPSSEMQMANSPSTFLDFNFRLPQAFYSLRNATETSIQVCRRAFFP